MNRGTRAALRVVFIFVVPVALLYFGLVPAETRLWFLALFCAFAAVLAVTTGRSARALGFRADNLRECALPYALFTVGGIGFVLAVAAVLRMEQVENWREQWHFVFLFLPVSVAQEFLYRGYLMPELRGVIKTAWLVIVVNAVLFTLLHAIYPNALVMLPLAAAAGLSFAAMYRRYPNLLLVSLSHAALNFTATLFSFFNLA